MKILVKLHNGKVFQLSVRAGETIGMVKELIQVKEGLRPEQQRLIFAGMLLQDSCTLADYDIHKGCCLLLVVPKASSREIESLLWWEEYACCFSKIYSRLTYHNCFDEEIEQQLKDLEKSNLSYDQEVAFLNLKALLQRESLNQQVLVTTVPSKRRGNCIDELNKGLKNAIVAYENAVATGKDIGPFIIHERVPFLPFEEWYKRQESCWRISYQFTNLESGTVLLYGDPSYIHESIAGWFDATLLEGASRLTDQRITPLLNFFRSSRAILPNGSHKEPDFSVHPKNSNCSISPFVGEVAYGNESLPVLQGELIQWTLPGGAEIAYGVKLSGSNDESGAKSKVSFRFLERRQGHPTFTQDIDFSPEFCTKPCDPDFLVKFPLRVLFANIDDKRLREGTVVFDLYELQRDILGLMSNSTLDMVWNPQHRGHSDGSPLLKPKTSKQKRKSKLRQLLHI